MSDEPEPLVDYDEFDTDQGSIGFDSAGHDPSVAGVDLETIYPETTASLMDSVGEINIDLNLYSDEDEEDRESAVSSAAAAISSNLNSQLSVDFGPVMETIDSAFPQGRIEAHDWYQMYETDPRNIEVIELDIGGQVEIETFNVHPTEHDRRLGEVTLTRTVEGQWAAFADYDLPQCEVGNCRMDGIHKFKGKRLCDDHLESAHQTM